MKRNQRTCVRIQMSRRARKDMSTGRIQDLWADPWKPVKRPSIFHLHRVSEFSPKLTLIKSQLLASSFQLSNSISNSNFTHSNGRATKATTRATQKGGNNLIGRISKGYWTRRQSHQVESSAGQIPAAVQLFFRSTNTVPTFLFYGSLTTKIQETDSLFHYFNWNRCSIPLE